MTSVAPPTEFFPGIDFNPSFYNLGQSAVTLDYLQSNYLRSTGYSISRAQFTLFNGTVDINENLDVSGNINASAYLLNGVPFTPSQWTTSVNDIYYTTGNVGIGKTNPTYKLDVSGNINCNAIFRSGTELTQYTDANVRTVLSTSAGTNMTWNTGTNKFDVAAPYTDTNVRTVLSTSAGTNMTWNTGTNKFDVSVVFPPSYTDTNTRTVLSTSAGTNMTWNTGTNKFDVAVTSYTLPTAGTGTGGTLGGVKVDGTTISINASTGVISRTGNTILLNVTTTGEYYGWTGLSSGLFRVGTNGQYSTGSLVEDIVLRSNGDVLLQSGIGNYGMRINTSNNILMRNAVGVGSTSITAGFNLDVTGNVTMRNAACIGSTTITSGFALDITGNVAMRTGLVVGGTAITSGYTLDVKGDVITSGNINFANTSRSIFWGGSNSSLARVGVAGQYSSSSVIDDIILRSGNRLLLQSGTGTAAMVINTDNNVFIGASTNSSDDGNVNIAIPDSTFYVRGPRTIGSTTNISFRGGLEGNANGKVRIWLSSDAAHSSYIESNHTGNGNTTLSFGTSNGNALPTEKLRIENNGNTSISGDLFITSSRLVLRGTSPTLYLRDTDQRSGMIHMNSSVMYFLNANGNDSETWLQQNGQDWCLQLNMNNNEAKFGGNIIAGSYIASSSFLQGAGAGGAYRILRYDNWVRLMNTAQNLHLDFAAGRLYAHYELDVQGASTFNAGTTFNGVVYCYNGFIIYNNLLLRLTNISSTNTDYVCVSGNTSFQSVNDKILYIANGTFTGFHRNYTDDELFDAENPEIFKNSFIGCIVISSGKIKTDYSAIEEEINEEDEKLNSKVEWKSAIGKEGIFIEDALPIVKLSRVKKDKRVFGVVGDPTRSNNSKERLIINSVGEGAICVCNTNGNIENGDYIQSSDVLGHGEKQDDDILHNYTVAKATIDCNFELNSPYYECIERPDGIRTAFIACTYHCG
jgi:hypothetical protein